MIRLQKCSAPSNKTDPCLQAIQQDQIKDNPPKDFEPRDRELGHAEASICLNHQPSGSALLNKDSGHHPQVVQAISPSPGPSPLCFATLEPTACRS